MSASPRCPICRRPVDLRPTNSSFPFCAERCRLLDLGGWMSESYRVPGPPADLEDDERRTGEPPADSGDGAAG